MIYIYHLFTPLLSCCIPINSKSRNLPGKVQYNSIEIRFWNQLGKSRFSHSEMWLWLCDVILPRDKMIQRQESKAQEMNYSVHNHTPKKQMLSLHTIIYTPLFGCLETYFQSKCLHCYLLLYKSSSECLAMEVSDIYKERISHILSRLDCSIRTAVARDILGFLKRSPKEP